MLRSPWPKDAAEGSGLRKADEGVQGGVASTPERTCLGCRAKGHKAELLRIVRGPDGVRPD
ncbi:MAG: DUF448 domain-containing protein, partial [Actinomycetota bacterium]